MNRISFELAVDILNDNGVNLKKVDVTKNGGSKRAACKLGVAASPLLYEDMMASMMDDCLSISEFVRKAEKFFTTDNSDLFRHATDPHVILNGIVPVLYGGEFAKQLAAQRMLNREFAGDMKIFFRVVLTDEMSYCVSEDILAAAGIKEEDAVAAAFHNITPKIQAMMEVMLEMSGVNANVPIDDDTQMIVIRANESPYGAGAIAMESTRQKIYDLVGDYYIIPSSIYEVLVVPKKVTADEEYLRDMVKQVNETEVAAMDQLSDTVIFYDGTHLRAF